MNPATVAGVGRSLEGGLRNVLHAGEALTNPRVRSGLAESFTQRASGLIATFDSSLKGGVGHLLDTDSLSKFVKSLEQSSAELTQESARIYSANVRKPRADSRAAAARSRSRGRRSPTVRRPPASGRVAPADSLVSLATQVSMADVAVSGVPIVGTDGTHDLSVQRRADLEDRLRALEVTVDPMFRDFVHRELKSPTGTLVSWLAAPPSVYDLAGWLALLLSCGYTPIVVALTVALVLRMILQLSEK